MGGFEKLMSPLEITPKIIFKNRIMKTGQSTFRWNDDGTADGSAAIGLYESIAAGGAAAVIIGGVMWDDMPGRYCNVWDDKFIPGLTELAEAVHRHDSYIIGQLHHGGPSAAVLGEGRPFSSSTIETEDLPIPEPEGRATRGLSVEEIHEKEKLIVEGAVRMKKAGFDGVEVHAAHGYLLNSFLSPIWNKRDDEYAFENVANRTRVMAELYQMIRQACGPDFLIGTRINGIEFSPLTGNNGITPDMARDTAIALEMIGYQYISVTGYGYGELPFRFIPDYFPYPDPEPHMRPYMKDYEDMGLLLPAAKYIHDAVKVPVVCVGRMDEVKGERALEEGYADIIGFGRYLWADPEFPNKVKEGRIDEIRRCNRCGSCQDPLVSPRICRVNPALGREKELALTPVSERKKVMVIGGGPAGMQAAIDAAARGHDVDLYERSGELGGRLKLASMIKGNKVEDIMPIYDYLTTMVGKSDVRVHLNEEASAELVRRERPDVVILANSSPYLIPDIPGIDGGNVYTIPGLSKLAKLPLKLFSPEFIHKASRHFMPVGKKIVVLGAGAEGAQCATFMAHCGKDVTLLSEDDDIGGLVPVPYKVRLEPWFEENGVEVVRNATCKEIRKGLVIAEVDGRERTFGCDSVLVMLPEKRDAAFCDELRNAGVEVVEIGSTMGGDNAFVKHAIIDGREAACRI